MKDRDERPRGIEILMSDTFHDQTVATEPFRLMNSLLCVKSQLLEHPVLVGLFNICFPNFPVSHDLSRQSVLRRCQNRSRIPRLRLTPECVQWPCEGS